MEPKGSITIFFTLLLSIVISLIGTLLLSARIAAGRTQIAVAMDQAMFSAMAKYDRVLFDEYHLLYIDGSYGTGTLQLGKALDEIESDLSYLLTPNKECEIMGGTNLINLERMSGSITGYTLATDRNGSVFYEQAVSYMEETLGLQGISLLSQKLTSEQAMIQSQERTRQDTEAQGNLEDYEKIKTEAGNPPEDISTNEPVTEEEKTLADQAETVMDAVSVVKGTSLMQIVLPNPQAVSGWTGSWSTLYRHRQLSSGMGLLELKREETSAADDLLFQEYILQNLNHYGTEKRDTGPAYGVEWVIFEKTSDLDNLKSTINRLMLIREAANVVSLRKDSGRFGQVQVMAEALAAVLKMPAIQPMLEGALVLAWAYAESLVDVRGLMEGKEVPLIKSTEFWQVEFWEILSAIQSPEQLYKECDGLSYKDYLRTFLLLKSKEDKIQGCIEVIEESMREIPGKETFSMDCALDSVEAEFDIRVQGTVTFTITEKRSYRSM